MATQPHPLAASAGFGIAASLLVAVLIPAGGLASPLLVATVACAVGAPLSAWLWRQARTPPDPVARAAADGAAIVLLAALLGPVAATTPVLALAVLGLWLACWLLVDQALLAGAAMWGVALVMAVVLGATQPIATALLPVPSAIGPTVALALPLGLMLAGAGLAGWSTELPRVPGDRGTPWVAAGVAVLSLLAVSVVAAASYGASLGEAAGVPRSLVLALATPGLLSWSSLGGRSRARLLAGVGATAWVAAAVAVGALALPHLAVHVLVPCLMALVLARRAAQAGGTSRMVVGAVAVGLVLCGAAAFQPPESVPEAAAWGILVVAAFWAVMARWPTTVQEVVR